MKLALAGDTMLGRRVAEAMARSPAHELVDARVADILHEADLFVLNLECCISARGARWPDPFKPFFFRALPAAAEALAQLGVSCVTLANNHALDFGEIALLDTFTHLDAAGIAWVGAGPDLERARAPVVLEAAGVQLGVIGCSDHPADYAATAGRPGIALAELGSRSVPDWLVRTIGGIEADVVLVSPHWGPNMTSEPIRRVRAAAEILLQAGAHLVAGHSAHVFHGAMGRVLFDLGGFVDDYRVDPVLRNDLGLLALVELDTLGPVRAELVPLKLEYCYTTLAEGDDATWARNRFREASAALGTAVSEEHGRLAVAFR